MCKICNYWAVKVRLGWSSREGCGEAASYGTLLVVSVVCLFDPPLIGSMTPLAAVMGTSVFGQDPVIPEVWAWSGGG